MATVTKEIVEGNLDEGLHCKQNDGKDSFRGSIVDIIIVTRVLRG